MILRRTAWAVSVAVLGVPVLPANATPRPDVVTKAEYIAGQLAHDPVFIDDDVPRDVSPSDAAKIRATIRRMPTPTYLAVVAETDTQNDPQGDPERLIALLHDRLGRDGVYLVMSSDGIGVTAGQFGTSLPLHAASSEVTFYEPYNAGPVRTIARFVDDIRSGQAQQRYDRVYAKSKTGWDAKPYGEPADAVDTAQEAGAIAGLAVAALGMGAVAWRRTRRSR